MTTKNKAPPRRKRPTPQPRIPSDSGNLLTLLRGVIQRMNPSPVLDGKPDQLTAADRSLAATVLAMVARDEDPRDLFWSSVTHRPKGDDPRRADAAIVYWSLVTLGEKKAGKKLRGQIADFAGLTDDQVNHAVREYHYSTVAMIKAFGRELALIKAEDAAERLEQREK